MPENHSRVTVEMVLMNECDMHGKDGGRNWFLCAYEGLIRIKPLLEEIKIKMYRKASRRESVTQNKFLGK